MTQNPAVFLATAEAERPSRPTGLGLIGGLLGVLLALILTIAAVAAAVIGVLVAFAALVTRLAPRKTRGAGPGAPLLEGRATPDGWVAEPTSPSAR